MAYRETNNFNNMKGNGNWDEESNGTALFRRSVPLLKTVHGQFLKFLYKT